MYLINDLRRSVIILVSFFVSLTAMAQDIHWTQFNDNPVFLNPGYSGHFNGDYRFIANYRDQWRSVTAPFNTISFSGDAHLNRNKAFGYGLLFFHDVAGDGKFRTIELQGSISYLFKLTKDSTQSIRPGLTIGMNHRQFNFDQFYFDNQYNGVSYDPSLSTGENYSSDRKTNFSLGSGIVYQYYKNERFQFTGGFAAFNLNKPNQGFYGTVIQRDIRYVFSGRGLVKINYDWDLVPGLNLSFQGKYRDLMLGSSVKYTLINRMGTYRALYAGLWYRNMDAFNISAGFDYQAWFVGVSYDINFSKLVPASRTQGAFELAVRYILFQFKPKKIVHRICPDYI